MARPSAINVLGWAPDGRHLLLDTGILEVADALGQTVATPAGMSATWIDSKRLATWTPAGPVSALGSVTIVGLDGSASPIPGSYFGLGLIGDGAGDLALMPSSASALSPADRFVIWSNGQLGNPLPGWPLGWSGDGSTLIIATTPALGGPAGSNRSVSIAVMHRPFLAKARPIANLRVDPDYVPVFDPAGNQVAFQCAAIEDLGECHQVVLDLRTGGVHNIASQPPGLPLSWTGNGWIFLAADPPSGAGVIRDWSGSNVVASKLPRASWAFAASSDYVALVTEAADATHTTRILDPSGAAVASLAGIPVAWSADGSAVAVMADSGLQVTLLRVP